MNDVVVIGAGPAGSSVALQLAREGYRVALVDRSRFPRYKVCGDYLCAGAIEQLERLGVAQETLAGANPITHITLQGFGERLSLPLPAGGAVSLPREIFDTRLRGAALAAGAQPMQGSFLEAKAIRHGLDVRLRDTSGNEITIQTHVLIGADGARSVVAQRCGLAKPRNGRAGRWAVGGRVRRQETGTGLEMFVAREGYYARNPLQPGVTNSMLVLARPPRAERADAIVARLTNGARRFEPENIDRFVAVGPLAYRAGDVVRDSILLTGDAVELLDPFTGQGVAAALALSEPVAHAVRALRAGVTSERVGRELRSAFKEIVAPRRAIGALVRTMIAVDYLRRNCLRNLHKDRALLHQLAATVSGTLPPRELLAPRTLWRLLVA